MLLYQPLCARPFCEWTTTDQQIDVDGVIEIESLLVTTYKGLCPWVSIDLQWVGVGWDVDMFISHSSCNPE